MAVVTQVRKVNVPWPFKGSVVLVLWWICALCLVIGPWIDPRLADHRPGLLNGLIGIAFGILGGIPAGWFAAKALHRRVIRTEGNVWVMLLVPDLDVRDMMLIPCFFIAAGSAGFCVWRLYTQFHLGWPWLSDHASLTNGTMTALMAAFSCAMSAMINRWYNQLPN